MNGLRIVVALASAAIVSACGQEQAATNGTAASSAAPKAADAAGVAEGFKAAKLPISEVSVVTASNDSNQLLGRPGQYTSKIFFFDGRHPKSAESDNENTVEVFASEADAKTRHDYIDSITKGVPALLQYQILEGKTLVRLSKALTPDEVDGYKKALGSVS